MYDYKCGSCENEFRASLPMSKRKEPEEAPCIKCGESGKITQQIGYAGICDPYRMGRIKPSDGHNEVMRMIRDGNPGSTVRVRD